MKFYKTNHKDFDADGRITGQLYVDPIVRKFLFYHGGEYFISDTLGLKLLVSTSEDMSGANYYVTQYYTKNNKNYWTGASKYLWYSGGSYIISNKLGFGTQEEWVRAYDDEGNYDEANSYWDGDEWWTSNTIEGEWTPRGSLKDSSDNTLYSEFAQIVGYKSSTLCGVYQELDTDGEIKPDGNTIAIGSPQYSDDDGDIYIRSAEQINGYYSYEGDKRIYHDGEDWVIGTRDSISGWWEGSEPNIDSAVTFRFKKPDGSEIETQDDIRVTFDEYVQSSKNKETLYNIEVSVWEK